MRCILVALPPQKDAHGAERSAPRSNPHEKETLTMALPLKRTLRELRTELSARLGFGTRVSSNVNLTLLNKFLQAAQEGMYYQYDFEELRKTTEDNAEDNIVTVVGQTLYDYPDDCEPVRIVEVFIYHRGRNAAGWIRLHEVTDMYKWPAEELEEARPLNYQRGQRLEIRPPPNAVYPLRIEYYQKPTRFTQDEDRATVDDVLVFQHALVSAKLHYRQPDVQVESDMLTALLARLRRGYPGRCGL